MNDATDELLERATLTFTDQKNAVRGEQITHRPTGDPLLCPVRALARRVRHLRSHHAPPTTPLSTYFDNHSLPRTVEASYITNGLKHAANDLETSTGIPAACISARSLRPGGATALLCANVDSDAIILLGPLEI